MAASDTNAASLAEELHGLLLAAFISQAVTAAVNLGVADALSDGPLTIEELSSRTGTNPDALRRLLRALISKGIFLQDADACYQLTPLGGLLRSQVPMSVAAMARFVGSSQHRQHWTLLEDAIKAGTSVVPMLRGKTYFEYISDDPEFGQLFNDAMTSLSEMSIGAIIDAHDFTQYRTVIDVGGGHGRLLAAVLNAAPDACGVLYDLPKVISGAESLLREQQVAHRVEFVRGSFFDNVPAGGDAYLLKNIIHDWNDTEAVQILRNVRKSITAGAVLLLVETVLPDDDGGAVGKFMDLEMLVANNGRERTASEYRRLLDEADFEMTDVVSTASACHIVQARIA